MAKELKDMTVAEAKANGQEQAYSNLVASYGRGTPDTLIKPNISPVITTPIPVDGLTTPVTPISIKPVPPVPTTTRGIGNNVDSTLAGVGADLTTAPKLDEGTKSVTNLMNTYLNDVATPPEDINTAKGEEITKKRNAIKIQNELTTMDKVYRDEVTEIKKNLQGKLASGIQDEVNRVTDRYNNNRANVSIAYNTAIGDYNAAQETVALKTQAYTDKKDAEYKAWEMNYKMVTDFATPEQKAALAAKDAQMKANLTLMTEAKSVVMQKLLENNAPQSVWDSVDTASSNTNATPQDIYRAAGVYGTKDGVSSGSNTVNDNLTSYAAQYASTGVLPSASDMKYSNLTVGQITSQAKQLPKSSGQIVNTITGVNDSKTPATEQADYVRLNNIRKNTERLLELDKERLGGLVSGTLGKVFGSEKQAEYMTIRKSIVDDMSRMQSGAALTAQEIETYQDYLPGRISNSFGLGVSSEKKIENFQNIITNRLNERLNSNGLSMYGYTKIKVGGVDRTVGEVIDIKGTQYKVLPDGTLTDII